MAADLKPKAKRLVAEFHTKLNMGGVDSRRAAFVVLAVAKGWRNARMARYLDVSRARIGQRIKKYRGYAKTGEWPEIEASLAKALPQVEENGGANVSFTKEDWESEDFVNDLLNRLV